METKPVAPIEAPDEPIVGNATFDKYLKVFVSSIEKAKDAALNCANLSILHFEAHGDVSLCQRFLNAMPKNFTRRAAYVMWLQAFSPLKVTRLKDGEIKLSKDKTATATRYNTVVAIQAAFWDFAPDPQDIEMTDDMAFKRIMSAINSLRRKNVKTSDGIKALLNAVENVVVHYQNEAKKHPAQAGASEAPLPEAAAAA